MKNLILYAGDYLYINGKVYGVGEYGCNYPVNDSLFNADITLSSGTNIVTTTGDFNVLLGSSNSNQLAYSWLIAESAIIKIDYLLSETEAVITLPTSYNGTFNFVAVDFFGQPRVKQTYATDASAGFGGSAVVYTKNGPATMQVTSDITPVGAEPLLVHFAGDFAQYALNIQYA